MKSLFTITSLCTDPLHPRLMLLLCLLMPWTCLPRPGSCSERPLPPEKSGVELDGRTTFVIPVADLELSTDAISVAAWVKLDRPEPDRSEVFVNCGPASGMFTFYLYRNQVRMLIGCQSGRYHHVQAPPPEAGVWTHYVGTFDCETIRIYRNGQLHGTGAVSGPMQPLTGMLHIGALDHGERCLTGSMEDVQLWRRALSDAETAAVAAGRAGPEQDRDLVAHWNSDQADETNWIAKAGAAQTARPSPSTHRLTAKRSVGQQPQLLINRPASGYHGIWYMNQPTADQYVYKYSGGLGTYCANHIPHAWYAPAVNKTFFTYGGTTTDGPRSLLHMVSYYDHETGEVPRPTILLDKRTNDAHDNPVINLDDQGYIWIFSSSHGTARPSYISRSRQPYSIETFDLVWTGNFSYPQPWFIPGQGFFLLHTYYSGGRANALMTSPDGRNWSERRILSRIDQGHYQISNVWQNRKIGVAFNYHPETLGLNHRTNLYYMESSDFGQTWQSVDGEPLPSMLTEVQNRALVHDYQSEGLKVYTQDISFDSHGRPIIMYLTTAGYEPGPENAPRVWRIARWDGDRWIITGGDITSDNAYDFGSLYVESDDLWRVIGPTAVGPQAYNPGGEIAMWISRDQGASWQQQRQLTAGSPYNHTFVRRPINAHPDFYAFWADGHGRQPSPSRLYFCNRHGDVFQLPEEMPDERANPVPVGIDPPQTPP